MTQIEYFSGPAQPRLVSKRIMEDVLEAHTVKINHVPENIPDNKYIAATLFSGLVKFYNDYIKPNMVMTIAILLFCLFLLSKYLLINEQKEEMFKELEQTKDIDTGTDIELGETFDINVEKINDI